jgi:hypothetical protein
MWLQWLGIEFAYNTHVAQAKFIIPFDFVTWNACNLIFFYIQIFCCEIMLEYLFEIDNFNLRWVW